MTTQGQMINAYVAGRGNLSPEDQALVARRARAMGPAYRLFYETPVHLVRGELEVNGQRLMRGDAAMIEAQSRLELGEGVDAEVLVFDLAS